jgi:hypothetical protein
VTARSKLNEARKRFHTAKLKKTGHNKFAGYYYFELGDFLVPALEIFYELKLSAIVSFATDIATMTITDLEDEASQVVITSPMSTAQLKACHEVQNLGAVQTYIRRYLWVDALEIVEHDEVDASAGVDEPKKPKAGERKANGTLQGPDVPPEPDPFAAIPEARRGEINEMAGYMVELFREGQELKPIELAYSLTDTDEQLYLWKLLKPESKLRALIKANSPHSQPKEKA